MVNEPEMLQWLMRSPAGLDAVAARQAEARQGQLTKPPGALGRLESVATRLAAMQGTPHPCVDAVAIAVFAADHGVAAQGVSAFPQAVTGEMVRNFARGGAAINVLARSLGAALEVINLGTVAELEPLEGVRNNALGAGSADFTRGAAMTGQQLEHALEAGRDAAGRAKGIGAQLFIGGEMGIGNTTAATAVACALLGVPPESLAGPGTGLDLAGVARKVEVIRAALDLHRGHLHHPYELLRRIGGFEIAALTGAYVACAQSGVAVLVDGFISTAAALMAEQLREGAARWFLFSHASAEPGHQRLLDSLDARPLLNLGMRLGEGSGAAVAVPLLRMACALHNEMATFPEAQVSERL